MAGTGIEKTAARLVDRRALLRGTAIGAAAVAVTGVGGIAAAFAQQRQQGRSVFGVPIPDIPLPDAVADLIPAGATDVLSTIEAISALEVRADTLRLPSSPLSIAGMIPRNLSLDSLYAAALPRLVALIDRSDRRNRGFADQAGGLLARLHAGEHNVPDGLRPGGGGVIGGFGLLGMSMLNLQSVEPPPVAVPLPDAVPVPPAVDVPPVDTPVMTSEPVVQTLPTPTDVPAPPPADPNVVTLPQADPSAMRRSTRYPELREEYLGLFATATLRDERAETARWYLTMMRQSRARYEAVQRRTGVPWYFIGATHGLEASFNFRAHFHNGDFPLSARTRQVPAGRPTTWLPPSDWESSAIDALRLMGFTGQSDWSLARTLYRMEAFNGFGYRSRGVPTPYLWSFSSHYDRGKFVADGRWNPQARSQQCGTAVMLKLLVDAGEVTLPSE
jgi:lysozyme family protein